MTQSAHSAAVHGGALTLPMSLMLPGTTDDAAEAWEIISEDSFHIVGGGYCRVSTELGERYRWTLWQNKRAAIWSLERDMFELLSARVKVRIATSDEKPRISARGWFANGSAAQKRLDDALQTALVALVARTEEANRINELTALAQRMTSADHELSYSSWVRRMGVPVRPSRFCAFPWFASCSFGANLVQAVGLLQQQEPLPSARIARRTAPAHCSARAGSRRSKRTNLSTHKGSRSRARAEAARVMNRRRKWAADEKTRERESWLGVTV